MLKVFEVFSVTKGLLHIPIYIKSFHHCNGSYIIMLPLEYIYQMYFPHKHILLYYILFIIDASIPTLIDVRCIEDYISPPIKYPDVVTPNAYTFTQKSIIGTIIFFGCKCIGKSIGSSTTIQAFEGKEDVGVL
jgi:hypothetical protein